MSITAMKLALDSLNESVDMVRNEYEEAVHLYGTYQGRAGKISYMLARLRSHEKSIDCLIEAIADAENKEKLA